MGAPSGNKFWEMRSKHGRKRLFESADLMWEAACQYFQWCDDNPWVKNEAVKSGDLAGTIIPVPTSRPYTIEGLCSYLDCHKQYFNHFKNNLKESDKDFYIVVTRIEEAIYRQKFEGASVGAFNANIIARDLGLADKKDMDLKNNGESFQPPQIVVTKPNE